MKKSTISKIIAIISYHVTKKGSQKFKKKTKLHGNSESVRSPE